MEGLINQKYAIKDDIYKALESMIICPLCKNIFINPEMCLICQKVYCKKCLEKWSEENRKCPNGCDEPNYKESLGKNELLSQLKFMCIKCGRQVLYINVQKHLETNCNSGAIPLKGLKKLSSGQVNEYKKKSKDVSHMTSKNKNY